jgi:hypothetical protein
MWPSTGPLLHGSVTACACQKVRRLLNSHTRTEGMGAEQGVNWVRRSGPAGGHEATGAVLR